MVFYESYLLFSKVANPDEIGSVLSHIAKLANTYHGVLLRTQDLGIRYTSHRVNKARVGVFWYGRYFYVALAANPKIVPNLHKLYNSNSSILRHTTIRMLYRTNLMTSPYSHLYDP
ncbi:uncharacterized protein TOT_040000435 [Theileria orientalis strain Shintoku]|uniref:30S ribosomal protein S6 n=1 Tax=Theileria orientalis strain Shintoku TaxID=869250 RepID=J4DQ94_THEOR|nr:uncharacterized protein TOT_040000435 [Theileria orientalis strain Shintoku]PVC51412.1 hypothetical protein MACL_00001567 [Theileria orientalis]BAM42059.1 uncharacterized protein TOT_040000435 [Theileria orientalis strain Shintoku]|eukprot:XP_009692360.1 uncharacterized protein TOT_040000435 [Theileria orientalis strain Shintoku]